MLFDSTRSLLQSIVLGLEKTGDESRWDDQTESGNTCLYEMHQMSGHLYQAYKTDNAGAKARPQSGLSDRLNRALPHVRSMTIAIRRKDRSVALESGKAGLAELNGASPCSPSVRSIEPNAESRNPVSLLKPKVKRGTTH
jgi:hypothetical protein